MEKSQITITLKTDSGEGKISGEAIILPIPRIFPPPFFVGFDKGYNVEGDFWEIGQFESISGKIEHKGRTYELPRSTCSSNKEEDFFELRLYLQEPPKDNLPYF